MRYERKSGRVWRRGNVAGLHFLAGTRLSGTERDEVSELPTVMPVSEGCQGQGGRGLLPVHGLRGWACGVDGTHLWLS